MGPRKKADATRALKRYNEQGYNVDAEDDNQIAAYWALRTTCGRVDGKTFTRYWERRKTNVEHGARSVLEYWGVPKENFPDGLPEEIKGSVVTERDLDEAELVGGGRVDHDRYFVVDCEVSRNLLKKNVRILKFYTGSQTKVGMSPGQAAGGHASTPPPATVRDQLRLHALLTRLRRTFHGKEAQYPLSCRAMAELSEAIVKEAPRRRWKPRASHRGDFVASYGRLRIRAWRAEKKVNELQDRLTKLTDSKTVGGRVSEEWITRVILTAPHVSGRALAETFHLAIGSDSNVISRDSIGAIRSAFLEMWKNLLFSSAKDFISVHRRDIANRTPAALGSGLMFLPLFISHVQDEADIRLLTSNPGSAPGLPRRSRSSKVQVNVVHLRVQGRSWALPHELEALADKSAPVLATCFKRLVQAWLAALVPPQAGGRGGSFRHNPEIWMLHCLIGDGIPTNVAAAKILWAFRDHVCEQDGTVVRYFLLVGKCGTHQTALSAKNGIVGRVAAAAAGDSTEYEGVTANAVRLFKYLVPDYYEDFKKSVATWVHDYLKVLLPSGAGELPQDRAQAGSLQVLYTKHVMTLRRVTRVVWRRPMCQQSMRPRANGQPQAAAGQPQAAHIYTTTGTFTSRATPST